MLEKEDVVLCTEKHDGKYEIINKFGIIKKVGNSLSCILFFDYVGGHDEVGEQGHCWWVDNRKLIKINNIKGVGLNEKGIRL